jgi:hypothetical protein
MNARGAAALLLALASARSGWACVLRGTVLDAETGRPVAAKVFAKPHADWVKPAILRSTGEDGAFCFERLEAGVYEVVADRAGYLPALYGARPGGEEGLPLSIDGKNELALLTLRLTRSATIAGMALDARGEPSAGSRVLLSRKVWNHGWKPEEVSSTDTDDNGSFRFSQLAPGTYYVSVESNGDRDQDENGRQTAAATTYFRGSLTFAGATPISLEAGQDTRNLVLAIEQVATRHLSGKISELVDMDVMGTLYLNSDNDTSKELSVGKDGTFSAGGLLPGKYWWQVTHSKLAFGARVDLTHGDVDDLILDPQETFDVRLSARVEGGAGTGQVRLYADSLDEKPSYVAAREPDGSYLLRGIMPGLYRLEAARDDHLFVKALAIDGKARPGAVLDLREGRPGKVEAILSAKTARIEGGLEGAGGALPALATTVVAMNEDKSQGEVKSVEITVDQTGEFGVEWLEPGKYRLFAIEGFDSGVWGSPELAASLAGKSLEVELHEGESESVRVKVITFEEWSAALRKAGM